MAHLRHSLVCLVAAQPWVVLNTVQATDSGRPLGSPLHICDTPSHPTHHYGQAYQGLHEDYTPVGTGQYMALCHLSCKSVTHHLVFENENIIEAILTSNLLQFILLNICWQVMAVVVVPSGYKYMAKLPWRIPFFTPLTLNRPISLGFPPSSHLHRMTGIPKVPIYGESREALWQII